MTPPGLRKCTPFNMNPVDIIVPPRKWKCHCSGSDVRRQSPDLGHPQIWR
jgi:hypothetical protein